MNETTNYGIDKLEADSIQTRSRIIWLNFGLMLLRADSPKPGYSGRGRRGNRVPRKPTLN